MIALAWQLGPRIHEIAGLSLKGIARDDQNRAVGDLRHKE
jgi:hypothetical protein